MFSKDLEHSIGQCYKRARDARHEFMTVEHLLLALLDNASAEAVLKAVGADFARLRHELEEAIEASVNQLAEDDGRDTQPTLGFQRVLQRAVYHVQSSGKKEVTGANVLVAIFGEKDSHAVVLPQPAGRAPARRGQLPVPRHRPQRWRRRSQGRATRRPQGEGGEGEHKGDALSEFASNLNELARGGQDRSAGRPRRGSRAHHPGPVPSPQEQPAVRGRGRRRQDRAGRGPGQAHRRWRRARRAERGGDLFARPRRAGRRDQVPRRLREAPERRAGGAEEGARRDPVHRRDPHDHRCRFRLRRHHGCLQPDQAGAGQWRVALHRLDHLPGIPRDLREGPRAGASLPEDRHRRTHRGRDHRDPAGPQAALRIAPRRELCGRGDQGRGGPVGQAHRRPPVAGQGDRRDRRSRCAPAPDAGGIAQEPDRRRGNRDDRGQDGADPGQAGQLVGQGRAPAPGAQPEDGDLRPGSRRSAA